MVKFQEAVVGLSRRNTVHFSIADDPIFFFKNPRSPRCVSEGVSRMGRLGIVAFRSAKVALNPRCFRGAKGDDLGW
jgi:hypothetical protein